MSLPPGGSLLVHFAGSLVVGAMAWGVGAAIHRLLRLSHAWTHYWLGVWAVAVLPPVAAVMLDICAPAHVSAFQGSLPLPISIDHGGMNMPGVATPIFTLSTPPTVASILVALYVCGFGLALLRLIVDSWWVWRIVQTSVPTLPGELPGPASARDAERICRSGVTLRVTPHPVSPFAVSWPAPTIVLPEHTFQHLDDNQLRLIVRHEAAHLSRRDPLRAGVMRLLGTLLWFNPFVRMIAVRVQIASELRCDALSINADSAAGRDLASAYVQTLRMTACASRTVPAAALTRLKLAEHTMRLEHMLHGDSRRTASGCSVVALTAGMLIAGSVLAVTQVAMATPVATGHPTASRPHPVRGSHSQPDQVAHSVRFIFPIRSARITGHFGDTGGIRSRPHRGTDFGAKRGTPVLAPAAGRVVAATHDYPDGPNYGTVVVLDHGGGWQTLYAHLDGFEVRVGQQVHAGEQIARVGRTGKVTGPHLHLEMLLNGQRIDPESQLRMN